jgi:hypothetical protein
LQNDWFATQFSNCWIHVGLCVFHTHDACLWSFKHIMFEDSNPCQFEDSNDAMFEDSNHAMFDDWNCVIFDYSNYAWRYTNDYYRKYPCLNFRITCAAMLVTGFSWGLAGRACLHRKQLMGNLSINNFIWHNCIYLHIQIQLYI